MNRIAFNGPGMINPAMPLFDRIVAGMAIVFAFAGVVVLGAICLMAMCESYGRWNNPINQLVVSLDRHDQS